MNVVPIKRPPADLSKRLRELADMVDEGVVTDAVMAYVCDDRREFLYASSLSECLVMSAMLQQNCIDRMRA